MAMSNIPIIFMLTNQARFPFVTETTKKKKKQFEFEIVILPVTATTISKLCCFSSLVHHIKYYINVI